MAEQSPAARPPAEGEPRPAPGPSREDDGLRPANGVDRIGDALAPGAVPGGAKLPATEGGHFEPAGPPPAPAPGAEGPDTNEEGGQGHETA